MLTQPSLPASNNNYLPYRNSEPPGIIRIRFKLGFSGIIAVHSSLMTQNLLIQDILLFHKII